MSNPTDRGDMHEDNTHGNDKHGDGDIEDHGPGSGEVDARFQILFNGESGARSESWIEGSVPGRLLDPSEQTRPEMALAVLHELRAESRQNLDLSGADRIWADTGKNCLPNVLIERKDGGWKTQGWAPVPGHGPSEAPAGVPLPETSYVEVEEKGDLPF